MAFTWIPFCTSDSFHVCLTSSQYCLCSENPASLLTIQLFIKPIRVANIYSVKEYSTTMIRVLGSHKRFNNYLIKQTNEQRLQAKPKTVEDTLLNISWTSQPSDCKSSSTMKVECEYQLSLPFWKWAGRNAKRFWVKIAPSGERGSQVGNFKWTILRNCSRAI